MVFRNYHLEPFVIFYIQILQVVYKIVLKRYNIIAKQAKNEMYSIYYYILFYI